MKTVVITGSARGLGFNMARFFREYNYNVVISDLKEENLIKAKYCNTTYIKWFYLCRNRIFTC